MMPYRFIMLRKIDWHLFGIKNYELIIRLKQISVKPLKFVILHNVSWSEMGIFKVPLSWDFDEGDSEREIDSLVDRTVNDSLHPHRWDSELTNRR